MSVHVPSRHERFTLSPTHSLHDALRNAGGFFSSLLSKLWSEKEMRILILGLDGAGKTTILYRLQVRRLLFGRALPLEAFCV